MRSYYILIFSLALMGIAGCKKVIQLRINDVPPKIVIEANMSDEENDCKVIITRTAGLNEPSIFKAITGAKVSITEDNDNPVPLVETNPGVYKNPYLQARSGHRYTLNVEIEDHQFTSSVVTPQKTPLDSLYITDFFGFGKMRKFANIIFQDPPGIPNSYRAIQFRNGVENPNLFLLNDDFSDGRIINVFLAYFDDSDEGKIFPGDTISVQLQCIDPSVYLYFNSLNASSTGGDESAAPGNPVTNIRGGALGYFNAYTKQTKTVIAQ